MDHIVSKRNRLQYRRRRAHSQTGKSLVDNDIIAFLDRDKLFTVTSEYSHISWTSYSV